MAQIELSMPRMGESVAEATVIRWLKNEGEIVNMDEAVLEIATDKVDSDVPSTVHGRLVKKLFAEDDIVKVGEVIAIFETDINLFTENVQTSQNKININQPEKHKEESPKPEKEESSKPENEEISLRNIPGYQELQVKYERISPNGSYKNNKLKFSDLKTNEQKTSSANSGLKNQESGSSYLGNDHDRFYSPLVRSIALNEGISRKELDSIAGSGGDGRVTKQDILNYVGQKGGFNRGVESTVSTSHYQSGGEKGHNSGDEGSKETLNNSKHESEKGNKLTDEKGNNLVGENIQENNVLWDENKISEPVLVNTPQGGTNPSARIQDEFSVNKIPSVSGYPSNKSATIRTDSDKTAPISLASDKQAVALQAFNFEEGDEIIEMDRMRRLISDHMIHSKEISAHVTSFIEADVSSIVLWREKNKEEFKRRENEAITFTPFFIESVAKCLKEFPMVNVSVNGKQIILHKHINIGMATALPTGNLIVPVIRDADQMNLVGLAKHVNDLAKRARSNKLTPDEVSGGTFTLTNLGSFGNIMGTPIINQPQVAILATGAIKKKPSVVETAYGDVIAIRHKMYLSLSYDHRVVDGALGGRFLQRVAEHLESFDPGRDI